MIRYPAQGPTNPEDQSISGSPNYLGRSILLSHKPRPLGQRLGVTEPLVEIVSLRLAAGLYKNKYLPLFCFSFDHRILVYHVCKFDVCPLLTDYAFIYMYVYIKGLSPLFKYVDILTLYRILLWIRHTGTT